MVQEKAIFAGGCFWGDEDELKHMPGVIETTVGYTGGDVKNPTYEQVVSGKTGHAEAVEVIYDPKKVSYKELVEKFWELHDPTQLNRQGPDVGLNYRPVIFYVDDSQKVIAEASKKSVEESGTYDKPIVTQIQPAQPFYPAEEYHQDYVEKHGGAKVC